MTQAVVLAAGEGRRLRPLTHARPKALIPVANRPIIEYVIESLVKNGIRDITVVVGYRKEQVMRYLNTLDISLNIVIQDKQLGTAHALGCAASSINDRFLLLPGDNYIDYDSIARIKSENNAVLVKENPQPSNFGVVIQKGEYIERIDEKPEIAESFIVSTGIFSLMPSFLDAIRCGTDIPEAISCFIDGGASIRAIPAKDWMDAVYPWDLLTMNEKLITKVSPSRAGIFHRTSIIQGQVRVGKRTKIGPGAVIRGPVIIGEDCNIGPYCCIEPGTSIGDRVSIEPYTFVKDAIIMDSVSIGSHSRIVRSIIGEGCILLDHTSTVSRANMIEIEGKLLKPEFGTILGDSVCSAPFTTFHNCIIGNRTVVEVPGRSLYHMVPDDSRVV